MGPPRCGLGQDLALVGVVAGTLAAERKGGRGTALRWGRGARRTKLAVPPKASRDYLAPVLVAVAVVVVVVVVVLGLSHERMRPLK